MIMQDFMLFLVWSFHMSFLVSACRFYGLQENQYVFALNSQRWLLDGRKGWSESTLIYESMSVSFILFIISRLLSSFAIYYQYKTFFIEMFFRKYKMPGQTFIESTSFIEITIISFTFAFQVWEKKTLSGACYVQIFSPLPTRCDVWKVQTPPKCLLQERIL